MELYLTRHARNRLRLYEIPKEEARLALARPDEITPGERTTSGYG